MKNETIMERLAALREVMREEGIGGYVVPSGDPHGSEYVADHWKCREWISGFDGSAGTVVVTADAAALWTDSRYFIAASEQLRGTEYQLMKQGVAGTPTVAEWIEQQLTDSRHPSASTEIALDGTVSSVDDVEALIGEMRRRGGITVRTNLDAFSRIWKGRPPLPQGQILLHDLRFAGEPAADKLHRIRTVLRGQHADGMLVTALDDIAWTLNLRGSDIHCNPVFVGYLLISTAQAILFADRKKLPLDVQAYLADCHIDVDDYEHVGEGLRHYFEYNILVDRKQTNYTLYKTAQQHQRVVDGTSPIPTMKAIKNPTEQAGFREAMLRDGIAMVRFLRWLKPAVAAGGQTELSIARQLESLRQEQPGYHGPSFDTISAYQAHGAIVHYEPTPESDIPVKAEGFLLLDSGGQYDSGTPDITRTIALGPLTDEQRRVYTLVLKGHIQLELAFFPDGCSGTQIDALAREPLWRSGLNYLHGTGHGVGSYLCVHEGPHQVRMNYVAAPLHAGMTITDEPGVYLEGRFGVRIENTLLIKEAFETAFGRFLQMESLTLCPIDTNPIIPELLTEEERQWLNGYHRHVYETLAPHLGDEDRQWLKACTLGSDF